MRESKSKDQLNRAALAAAAMAFAPSTEVPRERALIRSAIISLLLTFGDKIFRRKEGVEAICGHGALPELRRELAESLFDKLISDNIVCSEGTNKSENFRFDEKFAQNAFAEQDRIDKSIDRVISDVFETDRLPQSVIWRLRKEMLVALARLMKGYGEQYAYQIAGRAEKPIVVHREELLGIYEETMSKDMKSYLKPEAMADAMTELFAQREAHFAAFVFSLTQNYFYLRLLGLGGGLEFLTEERFSGSQFLLDTNVLFPLLLKESRHRRSVMELVNVARQLKISLHETELTLDELQRVIEYNRTELAKAFDEIPDELVANTQSELLRSYRGRCKQEANLTVETYFAEFREAREKLEENWGISVFDDPVERIIEQTELNRTKGIIKKWSERVRHRRKPEMSLEHDAHVYYVVLAERERFGDKSAWLLTLDASLGHAAEELQGKEAVPFCMTLDGFLHIVSPYVRADHQQSFAEMFVELVGNNLFCPEEIIDVDDFLMFTDFDLSVRQLPGEDVKKVIRGVKKALDGKLPLDTERQRVAYEVQKALSDPTLKYRTELEQALKEREAQIERIEEARTRDREKLELVLERVKTEHRTEFEELNATLREMGEKSEEYEQEVESLLKKQRVAWLLFKAFSSLALFGAGVLCCWWLVDWRGDSVINPLLCKVSVAAAAVAAWVGIMSRQKLVSLILFVLAVLGVLYTAWGVFGQ